MSSFLTIAIDKPVRFSGMDRHYIKLREMYADAFANSLLARIEKKGGR